MDYNTDYNSEFILFLIVFLIVFLAIIAFVLIVWIPFRDELRYIEMEINRSQGGEKRYWEREKKKHYLKLIPFSKILFKKRK